MFPAAGVHLQQKTFECSECGARFQERWEVARHMRIAHRKNGDQATGDAASKSSVSGKSTLEAFVTFSVRF